MVIVYIILFVIFVVGWLAMYYASKDNEAELKKFKAQTIAGIIIIIVVCGSFALILNNCGGSDMPYSIEHKKIEKGYSSDEDYTPTFSKDGEYHNAGTGDRQIQYQGSREQKSDLEDIDRYAREHPDF